MTNEELAVMIQNGHTELYADLWEQVQHFITWKATLYLRTINGQNGSEDVTHGVDERDLTNEGYFALVKAVETYSAEEGCKFTTWLTYYLSKSFSRAWHGRAHWSGKNVSVMTMSTESPVTGADDDLTLGSLLVANKEEYLHVDSIENAEESVYIAQLRVALEKALDILPAMSRDVLRRHYFQQQTLDEIADVYNTSRQAIDQRELSALRLIRRTPTVMRDLYEFYAPESLGHSGYRSFERTGSSYQEVLVMNEERKKRRLREMAEKQIMEALVYINSASADYLIEGDAYGNE